MPTSDPKKSFERFIAEAVQVPLDKAGRICLPDEIIALAASLIGLFVGWI